MHNNIYVYIWYEMHCLRFIQINAETSDDKISRNLLKHILNTLVIPSRVYLWTAEQGDAYAENKVNNLGSEQKLLII